MPKSKELERLSGLLEKVADHNTHFLQKCSETKILAVSDYTSAIDQYRLLAMQVLDKKGLDISVPQSCGSHIEAAKSALHSDKLGSEFITALRELRSSYFDDILRPAVRRFLAEDGLSISEVKPLYERAVKIDGLLGVVEFFRKVEGS
ncbi:MAG: hypothetical protein RTU30_07225 [Candidatus Thorarchaeota archaeon]